MGDAAHVSCGDAMVCGYESAEGAANGSEHGQQHGSQRERKKSAGRGGG
jgi:hypothetical protein